MKKFSYYAMLLPTMLMMGCQQTPHAHIDHTPVQEQLAQLSAMLAGSEYLRYQCNREDIPDRKTLTQKALNMGAQRGWDTEAQEYKHLTVLTDQRYQKLLDDETAKEKKCELLSKSAAPFVSQPSTSSAHHEASESLF